MSSAREELTGTANEPGKYGTQYRFQQVYGSLPVHGRTVVLFVDLAGNIQSLRTNYLPLAAYHEQLTARPGITKEAAVRALKPQYKGARFSTPVLCVYSLDSHAQDPVLAYKVGFQKAGEEHTAFLDAATGDVLCIQSHTVY